MTQMEYFKNGIERGKKLAFIFRPVLDILLSKMQFLKSFYFYCRICEEVKVTGGSKARKVVRQKDWVIHHGRASTAGGRQVGATEGCVSHNTSP